MSDQAESRKRLVLLIVLLAAAGGGLFWVSTRPPETPDAAIQTKVDDLQAILDDAQAEREKQPVPEYDPGRGVSDGPSNMRSGGSGG